MRQKVYRTLTTVVEEMRVSASFKVDVDEALSLIENNEYHGINESAFVLSAISSPLEPTLSTCCVVGWIKSHQAHGHESTETSNLTSFAW